MTSLMNYSASLAVVGDTRASPQVTSPKAHESHYKSIIERLRVELPRGVYLSEDVVADLLGVNKKSLQNLRARKPKNFAQVHPPYIVWDGRRGVRFPREPLIEFLAAKEFESLTRYFHRCR